GRYQGGGRRGGRAVAEAGRVQAAQRLVERHVVGELGVVGEQREHVVVCGTEDVLHEAVQGLLRPDLDEDPGTGVVQRAQAGDELYRRRDLPAEQIEDRLDVGAGRVELPGH